MKKTILTAAILICTILNLSVYGQGNVSVSVINGLVQVQGDNYSNSMIMRSTRDGWMIEGSEGTTINGQQKVVVATSNALHIDLKHGNDKLSLSQLSVGELRVQNGIGNCHFNLSDLRFDAAVIMTQQGHDKIELSSCDGEFLRVGDGTGAFLLNEIVDGAYSSVQIENCEIKCVDSQSYDLTVFGLRGALRGAATEAMIQDVDSSSGDANLNFWGGDVSPSTVWLSCEANSRATDFYVRNIDCEQFGIVTTGTLLSQRFSEEDQLLIVDVDAEMVEIGTGKGSDWVLTSAVRTGDLLVSLGETRDDKNTGYFYHTVVEGKTEMFGGDRDDRFRLSGGVFSDDVDIETGDGNDRVEIFSVSLLDQVTIDLSGGNDFVEIGRSYLFDVSIDGGRHFDQVKKDLATWFSNFELDNVENDNLE